MIESIHIKNFRGIQDGKIDKFSKINLLVGPNNSGKSAVLEAIYLANTQSKEATFESEGFHFPAFTAERDLLGNDPLDIVCSKHLKKTSNSLTGGTVSKKWNSSSFLLSIQSSEEPPCRVASCIIAEDKHEVKNRFEKKSVEEFIPPSLSNFPEVPLKGRLTTLFWEHQLTYFQVPEATWITKGIKPCARNTLFYDVTLVLEHIPFEFFRLMLNAVPGWTHKIAASFDRIFQIKRKFNVTFLQLQHNMSQTQGYIAPEDKIALTIDDYGDGARSAFKLLTPLLALAELVTDEKPGVFIWEEPELFQNPRTIGKIIKEVLDIIAGKPIQLFIASHNLDLVAHFTSMVLDGHLKPEDLMTFRLNLDESTGKLTSSWFNFDNLKTWLEDGLDPRVWGEFKSPLHFRFDEEGE